MRHPCFVVSSWHCVFNGASWIQKLPNNNWRAEAPYQSSHCSCKNTTAAIKIMRKSFFFLLLQAWQVPCEQNKHRLSIARVKWLFLEAAQLPNKSTYKRQHRVSISLCNWIITGQRAQAQSMQKPSSKCQKAIEINYTSLKSPQRLGRP